MPHYRAPLEDYRFVLFDLLDLEGQRDLPGFAELSRSLVDDILGTAARFCEEVLQP
ncbi:MAG: acyl-CoA dehydrogenase N-terminal domain-containing protein, partial [Alphaproteobacteria bacterium]|nr:acyl-CoA dehydrogenase N-terminal domain-containing protein [Alphaproteobacteria bacterium]